MLIYEWTWMDYCDVAIFLRSRIVDDWVLKPAQGWCLTRIVSDFCCETIRAVGGQSFLSFAQLAVGLLAIDRKDLGQHGAQCMAIG